MFCYIGKMVEDFVFVVWGFERKGGEIYFDGLIGLDLVVDENKEFEYVVVI